jgi:hypothetical protein
LDRMKEKVHLVVARWMRTVLEDKGWSARFWAQEAGIEPTSITRVMVPPPGEEPIMPTVLSIAKLARVAGSQPDLVKGNRATGRYVRVDAATAHPQRKQRVG